MKNLFSFLKSPLKLGGIIIILIPLIYLFIYVALSKDGIYVLRNRSGGVIYDVYYPKGCFKLIDMGGGMGPRYTFEYTLLGVIYSPLIEIDRKYFNKSELAYSMEGDGYWVKPERQNAPVF